jgi:hypothetical protein
LNILEINMKALMETISLEDEELGKSFVDTHTGEVIYIPTEVSLALENGTLKESAFDAWLQEFVNVAILISEDEVNRYVPTPIIDETFYIRNMEEYINNVIDDSDLKLELHKALNSGQPIKEFKHVLLDKQDEIDHWYRYEDKCLEQFVIEWLKLSGIEVKYLN